MMIVKNDKKNLIYSVASKLKEFGFIYNDRRFNCDKCYRDKETMIMLKRAIDKKYNRAPVDEHYIVYFDLKTCNLTVVYGVYKMNRAVNPYYNDIISLKVFNRSDFKKALGFIKKYIKADLDKLIKEEYEQED